MSEFGEALREMRLRYGLARQQDLVDALGGDVSRSSVANIERGWQVPSARVWALLVGRFPGEEDALRPAYDRARAGQEQAAVARPRDRQPPRRESGHQGPSDFQLGGPYVVEQYDIVYVFKESSSPEEILEVRRVKALRGAQTYGLMDRAYGVRWL